MTNLFLSNQGAGLDGGLRALAPIGGKRRPVKLVEHPAFGPRRRLRAAGLEAAYIAVRLPVVTLDARPLPLGCRSMGAAA